MSSAWKRKISFVSSEELCELFGIGSSGEQQGSFSESSLAMVSAALNLSVRREIQQHLWMTKIKTFVSDCDQTLWGGVVSEDGKERLIWHEGPYSTLQHKLSIAERKYGKVLCLASKNDSEAVVEEVFEHFSSLSAEMGNASSA
eukprot:3033305-Amphidinium_carterae.1